MYGRSGWMAGRTGAMVAVLVALAALLLSGVVSPEISQASTRYLRIPEAVGSSAVDVEESWGYTVGTSPQLGAIVSAGTRSDTKKVTRTFKYQIKNSKLGLKMDIVATNVVRYEVYTSGPNKGKIYRFYKPTIVNQSGTASYLLIWKLTPKLTNEVFPPETSGAGYRYRLRHTLTFSFPRQMTIGRDQLSELVRKVFRFSFGPYERIINLVPDGQYGYLRVGLVE